ncbi:UDP-glycosyltransferase UGT5 [Tribolium castaneum]|uniref:UDP-glycosyltransferase UGT5 n=1 Tax=Tribolium castaneum TaxID=7070 RepID=UPI0000D56FB5|nr:PREDICTED: UDP-glucuronosyltransferase [Tribolium castaneum]|eukprot:XP_967685.3 PREDICTED: UDP-glucuronosyltransferase [Tribolium castaneum]
MIRNHYISTALSWYKTVLISYYGVKSAKILAVLPVAGKSHYILASTLMRALAERGHDVTVISCWGEKNPPKNGTYRDIVMTGAMEELQRHLSSKDSNMFTRKGVNVFVDVFFATMIIYRFNELTMKHENVQKFIRSGEKFDVVIVEQFANDALKALSTHFGAPLISLSAMGASYWTNPLVGNPSPPSYIPHFRSDFSTSMTFYERLVNSLLYAFHDLLYHFIVFPQQNQLMKKYIPNAPEHLNDVLYNSSIVLLNSHPSINQPVPHVPNMIEIGGYHLKRPKKLPQDLQEFLDSAKDGVIYFSMGSNLKSAVLPSDKCDAILKTFAKLKQKILWKWEEDDLPGKPPNVKTAKWLPQQELLAHPNVRLFITHGGLLSTTETIYHGVPILAIPIFGDQKINARSAVTSGYGVYLAFDKLNEETLTNSINQILNNKKYKENVQMRSRLFHDRLVSPLDTAIYWVEYVIRHRGAPHLRVTALDLPWYKYLLLDVIAVIALVLLSSLLIFCYIVKLIGRLVCSKKTKTSKKAKKE